MIEFKEPARALLHTFTYLSNKNVKISIEFNDHEGIVTIYNRRGSNAHFEVSVDRKMGYRGVRINFIIEEL